MFVLAGPDEQPSEEDGAPQPASASDIRSVVDRLQSQNRFAALAAHSSEAGDGVASRANGKASSSNRPTAVHGALDT